MSEKLNREQLRLSHDCKSFINPVDGMFTYGYEDDFEREEHTGDIPTQKQNRTDSENYTQVYNARLFDYPTGQHVSLYDRPITVGARHKNFKRNSENTDRTDEDEQHSINVSLARTKNTIYNIARSNRWDWFITLTIDPSKADRANYDVVVKKLQAFVNHLQTRKCPNLKYLIVPELHADGKNYHFHGLIADCDELHFIFSGKFDKTGKPVFNISEWKFGFTSATIVTDSSRISSYISKYVTKDSERYLKNKHRFYSNRNTERSEAEKVYIGDIGEFVKTYADDITFMKDVTVFTNDYEHKKIRSVKYLEIPHC